ncbi:MAG: hypothetical protein ACOVQ7_10315, partial [Limnoraphis robusta]
NLSEKDNTELTMLIRSSTLLSLALHGNPLGVGLLLRESSTDQRYTEPSEFSGRQGGCRKLS